MSPLVSSRLKSIITAGQQLIDQLSAFSNRAHLDTLYLYMLSTCSNGDGHSAGSLLGTIILLTKPTTPALLAALLDLPPQTVATHLAAFVDARLLATESPLGTITDTTTLRVCHDSLRDFVADPLRCRMEQYLVDPAKIHRTLLDRCLYLMNKYLHQDICDIHNPGLANAKIQDLPARIARSVPEAVRHACLWWPVHLVSIGSVAVDMPPGLLEFCKDHLLHWLEVLSLLGELSPAFEQFPRIIAWSQVSDSHTSKHYLMKSKRVVSRTGLQCKTSHCS
jgi:hypothetical protein